MSDTTVNMIKAIHEGLYDGIRGKKLKLSKQQLLLLNSNKRAKVVNYER
jgi:hypothetical protein